MKFSIITVCLNSGAKLLDTVNNALEQTYGDFEIVVKDGGSSDGSVEPIKDLCSGKIKVYSTKDSGIYDAMNEAVGYSQGEYIIFLNAGDRFYDRNVLENIALKHLPPSRTIAYGDTYFETSDSLSKAPPYINASVCYRNIPCHQAILYSRDTLLNRGFDTSLRIRADYEHFLYSYFKGNCDFKYLDLPVCRYEGNGFSESPDVKKKDRLEYNTAVRRYIPAVQRFIYRMTLILTLHKLRGKLARSKAFARPYQALKNVIYGLKTGGKSE